MRSSGALLAALALLGAPATEGGWGGDRTGDEVLSSAGPGDPGQIPLLEGFFTPTLAPGESGVLNFSVRNRYADATLVDWVVTVEIYKHATRGSAAVVDERFAGAPAICWEARPRNQCTTTDRVGGHPDLVPFSFPFHLRFDVHTSPSTPHGTLFDPGSYFVRIALEFTHSRVVGGKLNETRYKIISRGFITDADWEEANKGPGLDIGLISKRYSTPGLGYLDVIGIAPETSFTVRQPFPLWPLGVIIALAALTGILGTMLWMNEARGSFPWLRAAIDRATGKVRKQVPPRARKRRAT